MPAGRRAAGGEAMVTVLEQLLLCHAMEELLDQGPEPAGNK